MPGLLIKTKNG